MNEQPTLSPRQRLKELLAIPERQRTDEQWDEINELEITLASANRTESHEPAARRNAPSNQAKPSGGGQGKKPFKKPHKRPPKANTP
jgi:hypothetical protein